MKNYCVDVNYEYQEAKSKAFKLSLLFSIILTLVLLADVLLVVLSKEDYLVCLIIAIAITILFAWFAIYFFTNIFNDVNARYRYFKGYESGLKPIEEVEFISIKDELCYVNGLYVYPVIVNYIDGINKKEKIIYSLNKSLNYQEGDKLTIATYQRILLQAEKHK